VGAADDHVERTEELAEPRVDGAQLVVGDQAVPDRRLAAARPCPRRRCTERRR
jgi:hypothetical protein